jgi:hypothetical protein
MGRDARGLVWRVASLALELKAPLWPSVHLWLKTLSDNRPDDFAGDIGESEIATVVGIS